MTATIADAAARLGRTTACSPRDLLAAGELLRLFVPQGVAVEILNLVAEGARLDRVPALWVAQQILVAMQWKPLI